MRANRSNLPYLIAAAGGVVLVLSLFLTWLSVGDGFSLWKVYSAIDVVLALLGIAAAAIAAARITGNDLPVPAETLKWIGVVAATIVLAYLIEANNLGFGVFLGTLGALAILAGAILADRPDLADRVADAAGISSERPAAQPPAGLGSSSATATPATSAPASTPATTAPGAASAGAGAAIGGAGAAPAAAASSGPPAGWYPDPQGEARLRYWDGAAWTDQTSA